MTSLLELVEQLVDINIDGATTFDADERRSLANRAVVLHQSIHDRLAALESFHGTEAVRMRAILETGEDKPWWQA